MNEHDFAELSAAHALGALSSEDYAAFRKALSEHPEWSSIVEEDTATAAFLAEDAAPVAPPLTMRSSLLARISDLPQGLPPRPPLPVQRGSRAPVAARSEPLRGREPEASSEMTVEPAGEAAPGPEVGLGPGVALGPSVALGSSLVSPDIAAASDDVPSIDALPETELVPQVVAGPESIPETQVVPEVVVEPALAPESEQVPEPDAGSEPDLIPGPEVEPVSDTKPEPEPLFVPAPAVPSEPVAEPEFAPEPEVVVESEFAPEPEVVTESEFAPAPETVIDSEFAPESELEVVPEAEAATESEFATEPESPAELAPESGVAIETEVATESESEFATEPQSPAELAPESELEIEAEVEPEPEPEPEAEAEVVAESGFESSSAPEPEPHTETMTFTGLLQTVEPGRLPPRGSAEPPPTTAAIQAISRRNWTRGLLGLAASLVVLVVLGFSAVSINEWINRPPAVVALAEIEAAPDAQSGTVDIVDGGVATAHWSISLGTAVLVVEALPVIEADQTFEVWLLRDGGTAVSAGTFEPQDDKTTVLLAEDIEEGDTIAISIEQAGDSSGGEPTTEPIATIPTD